MNSLGMYRSLSTVRVCKIVCTVARSMWIKGHGKNMQSGVLKALL